MSTSLLGYYQSHHFNPVLIPVENPSIWATHVARRRNLYERHLGIPLTLLRDRAVLEFGPNSGENALVLAFSGAALTLVEPNEQVLPRLRDLFARMGVADRITALCHETIQTFSTTQLFDLVLAEGFLYTLPDRTALLGKIAGFLRPGGLGVVSFNDRMGGLLEMVRRMVLFRTCRLAGVREALSDDCRNLAERLYGDDFRRLPASRSFEMWWKDTLVNPFCAAASLWSLPEILPILTAHQCAFHSSSPLWVTNQHYTWYKDLSRGGWETEALLLNWRAEIPYFLTGLPGQGRRLDPAPLPVLQVLEKLLDDISIWTDAHCPNQGCPVYPEALGNYLASIPDPHIIQFHQDLKALFTGLGAHQANDLIACYHQGSLLRRLWGTAYHYLCFRKEGWLAPLPEPGRTSFTTGEDR